jgi:hypothetical protein
MTGPLRPAEMLVGLVRLRDHCTFAWEEPIGGGQRLAHVRRTHCEQCIAELGALGYLTVREDSDKSDGIGRS